MKSVAIVADLAVVFSGMAVVSLFTGCGDKGSDLTGKYEAATTKTNDFAKKFKDATKDDKTHEKKVCEDIEKEWKTEADKVNAANAEKAKAAKPADNDNKETKTEVDPDLTKATEAWTKSGTELLEAAKKCYNTAKDKPTPPYAAITPTGAFPIAH